MPEALFQTVHFPLDKPVPVKLISRIAKVRAAGIAATARKELPVTQKGTCKLLIRRSKKDGFR